MAHSFNNWSEKECMKAIEFLLKRSMTDFKLGKYENSAKGLVQTAKVIMKISDMRKKQKRTENDNEIIKDFRKDQKEKQAQIDDTRR